MKKSYYWVRFMNYGLPHAKLYYVSFSTDLEKALYEDYPTAMIYEVSYVPDEDVVKFKKEEY